MSFARTGEAAAQNYLLTTKAVAENSWDPNKLIKESIKGRSLQKQAAAQADAAKFESKQATRITEAKTKFAVDTLNMKQDLKKSKRKAGMIAAAGQTIATGLIKTPDPKKPYQSNLDSIYKEHGEKLEARLGELQTKQAEFKAAGPQYTELPSSVTGADPTSSTPGTLTPAAPMSASGKFVGGSLNPNDALAIKATAGRLGVDPYSLGGLFEMESGHRPNVWGGDGGNYKGLIQFGPGARSEVGLPNRDMTISEQLPYVEKYFNQRGFTPGKHGVTEMYRTVLVGNPGQSGTDSFGTNSDAASKRMMPGGDLYQRAQKLYGNWQSD